MADREDFVTDEELALLTKQSPTAETYENATMQAFRRAAPLAANQIVALAMHSPNDKLRFEASRYIVDRVLGKITEAPPTNEKGKSPTDEVFAAVLREPTAEERAMGQRIMR